MTHPIPMVVIFSTLIVLLYEYWLLNIKEQIQW